MQIASMAASSNWDVSPFRPVLFLILLGSGIINTGESLTEVIKFPGGKGGPPESWDHVITTKPMRLRWGDWRVRHAVQVHVGAAARYEEYRAECIAQKTEPGGQMPPHFKLNAGLQLTALAIFRHRNDQDSLYEISYHAALMEALINTRCPILRTDLIRRVYKEVEDLSQKLSLRWGGEATTFMLPTMEDASDPHLFQHKVAHITNLRDFFETVKSIAHKRQQIIQKTYVIYYPRQRSI